MIAVAVLWPFSLLVVAVAAALVAHRSARQGEDERVQVALVLAEVENERRMADSLLWQARREDPRNIAMVEPRPRLELAVNDWGESFGDMRWRWTIYDMDRLLVMAAHNVVDTDDEVPGVTIPFMLGNAPTKAMAEAEGLAWMDSHFEAPAAVYL